MLTGSLSICQAEMPMARDAFLVKQLSLRVIDIPAKLLSLGL
jgi:hypothetical protein